MPKMKQALCYLLLTMPLLGDATELRASDSDYREQQLKFARAYDAADYETALKAATKLHELRPGEVAHIYNVACMNCLLGNKDASYQWLNKLADAGFKDADGLLDDYDFRTMRAEPRFRAFVQRLRGEKTEDDRPVNDKPAKKDAKQKKAERDDDWDGPKEDRKIKKLDEKKAADDVRLSQEQMQRLGREIGQLTQELVETAPDDPKKALTIAQKAYGNARKIEASLKAVAPDAVGQIHPAMSLTAYNVACMQSLLGHKDAAFEHLDIAYEYGALNGGMLDQMSGDSDLDNLHSDRRYNKLIKKLGGEPVDAPAKPQPVAGGKFEETLPDVPEMGPQERYAQLGILTQKLIDTAGRGDKDAALDISLQAVAHAKILYDMAKDNEQYGRQVRTQWTLTNYNAACMYSLNKNIDAALFYLDRSVDDARYFPGGFVGQMEGDSDLDFIRKTDGYQRIHQRAKKAVAEQGNAANSSAAASDFKEDLPKVDKDLTLEARSARINELIQKAYRASQNKDIDKGFEYAHEAVAHVRMVYDDVKDDDRYKDRARATATLTDYNLACFYSLKENKDGALFYLARAAENKDYFPSDFAEQLKSDSDMDNIRDTPQFKAILRGTGNGNRSARRTEEREEPQDQTVDFDWKVTLPPNHDAAKAAPLIVALHHYHGNMNRTTATWQKAAAAVGAILLTPQGTVKLDDDMFHWGRDLDLVERDVMMAINKVMDEHKVDQKHIVLAGFSQGGWATWGIALRNPEAFCGIIPVCGAVRVDSDDAFKRDGLEKLRVWVMLGEDENSRVIESNENAADKLRDAGAKVEIKTYEGVGHGYPLDRDAELIKALKFVMNR